MLLDKLTSLARLTDAMGRATSPEEVYAASLDALQETLGVDRASILLFDANDVMSFVAWRGISDEYRAAVNGHTPWRPESQKPVPVLVPDAEKDPSLATYLDVFRREGIRALGFFALTHRDRVIGKFMLYYATPHEFTSEEIALAETIAGQIAFGVTRVRVEQALEAERERLAAIVANVPGIVWETTGTFPNQRLTFVSDGIRSLTGYSLEESTDDESFWDRVVVDRMGADLKSMSEKSLRDGVPATRRVKLRHRDGRIVWAEVRSAHKMVNGTLMSRGVTMDITARKEAEQRNAFLTEASGVLSASMDYEKSLTRVADLIATAIADWCVIDLVEDSEVVRIAASCADPAKADLMRRLKNEFAPSKHEIGLGRRVIETNEPLLITQRDEENSALLRNSAAAEVIEALGCESLMIVPLTAAGHAFGAISIVSANRARLFDNEDLIVAIELGRRAGYAIDHARLYRQATAANRAKDEFLATLSHELRTPMTAALGWASMLRLPDTPPETFKLAVETIDRSIRAQAKLIDDIFDVSRIVTGKLQLQIAPVDLARVIHAAIETIRPSINAKSLHLELVNDEGDALLLGDAARLQQVIWNLLSNAVKFTPAGGTVRVEVRRASNDEMQIAVSDTGPGIPKRLLPLIFERFRQGDSSATRSFGGLGLGLAIAKNLVELHGGSVSAASEGEGRGSVFTVRLPLSRPQSDRGKTNDAVAANTVSLDGIEVLVVEDDDDTRVMLAKALEQYGASVVAVSSAPAALDALRRRPPHVLVSDIAMPGEDGYSLISKIRSGEVESCRDVPAIAISAFARPEDRERLRAAGFREQLAKPVDAMVMLQTVRSVVTITG